MSYVKSKLEFNFQKIGKNVLYIEKLGLKELYQYINYDFQKTCEILFKCTGKVIIMGIGKSGYIARKIASTFSSTGTPSCFLHPADASHGDLGLVTSHDTIILVSNSGESREIIALISFLKEKNITLISITSRPESTIAKASDIHLCVKISREACPFNLAPTSSTTAVLVIGDALAIALLHARKFTIKDFSSSHPGGNLGRKLLLRVSDIMHIQKKIPIIQQNASVKDALLQIVRKKLEFGIVVNNLKKIKGVFTYDNLNKILDMHINFRNTLISSVMTKEYFFVYNNMLVSDVLKLMQTKKINLVIVSNKNQELLGIVSINDILKKGVF